jgi:uncharacterized membrane protein
MDDAGLKSWERKRRGGRAWYVGRYALVLGVCFATLFIIGHSLAAWIRGREISEWPVLLGAWLLSAAILLVPGIIWFSMIWNRREAAYRQGSEESDESGANDWN